MSKITTLTDKSNVYYVVLNTANNKAKGVEFHETTVKPDEGIDYNTRFVSWLGMSYDVNTSDEVIEILESAKLYKTRLVFDYGDSKTGRSWGEVNDICGYVGKSGGRYPFPILICRYYKDGRNHWGGSILDNSIVKISESKGKRVLYEHPTYLAAE